MSYNFGSADTLERELRAYFGKRPLGHLFPQDRRIKEIVERIHDEMSPEQFFEAWDMVADDRQADGFPVAPRWLRHFADLPFRQEFRVYWHRRHADYRDKYGVEFLELSLLLSLGEPFLVCFLTGLLSIVLATYISDNNVLQIFLSATGSILGIYVAVALLCAILRFFFIAPRRSIVCSINERRARQTGK